jgi:hypothetical protein
MYPHDHLADKRDVVFEICRATIGGKIVTITAVDGGEASGRIEYLDLDGVKLVDGNGITASIKWEDIEGVIVYGE